MQKKLLKILSVLVIIVGAAEALTALLIGAFGVFVFTNINMFEQTDVYIELTKVMNKNPVLETLGIDAVSLGAVIFFLLVADIAVRGICNFIYGKSGLKAAKGIKIKRARIIGTAALVIGICSIIDDIFVLDGSIGIYAVVYTAAAALFLYCVNGIISEKRCQR